MVKPALYPFKCREWDLASAAALRIEQSATMPRSVGWSQRERIAFARMGTKGMLMPVARQQETMG